MLKCRIKSLTGDHVSDWKTYFHKNAKKYTAAENPANGAYLTPSHNCHWMSAGDWLRSLDFLPFWHDISLEDIQRGSQDPTWLTRREQNVCDCKYITDDRLLIPSTGCFVY